MARKSTSAENSAEKMKGRGSLKVAFIASKEAIKKQLDQGYTGKSIFNELQENGAFPGTYRQFMTYLNASFGEPTKEQKAPIKTPSLSSSIKAVTVDTTQGGVTNSTIVPPTDNAITPTQESSSQPQRAVAKADKPLNIGAKDANRRQSDLI